MRFLLKILTISAIFAAMLAVFAYAYYASDLPDIENFDKDGVQKSLNITFSNDQPIKNYASNNQNKVQFYELPTNLINAVIAIEDRNFFNHGGFDVKAILRAFYVNQKSGRIVQGASTITQQLAKMLFLTPKRTLKRKIQELILARRLEQRFSKEQILTMYLNEAYFGAGNYGIASAAKYYFGKKVSQLSLKQSALLAGLLKAPSKLSPKNDRDLARDRAMLVLSRMIKYEFIDPNTLNYMDNGISYKTNRLQRLYFSDFVRSQYHDYINYQDSQNQKISINTTLNQKVQNKLEEELNRISDQYQKKLGKAQIAAIIMDKNGAILAMSGGKDYQKSQFNRAIYAKRQAGSAFKTFVYIAAFLKGYTPYDFITDKQIKFSDWLPNNYHNKYFGEVSLKTAFAKSLNSVAIQLAQKVGIKSIAKTARKLGITSKIDNRDLTTALGTTEVSLLELTSAYASILNDSKPIIPYYINKISDNEGNIFYQRQSSGFGPILSESVMAHTKEILRETVIEGTAKNANIARDIFGKTGTSQNYQDAWFVGFNDRFVMGVWIGNDDNSPTNKISGGGLPAKIFARTMSRL